MSSVLIAASVVSVLSGLLLRYWRGRRKFYRRNEAGIEGFSNYHRSLFTRSFESLCLLVSKFLIGAGLLLLSALSCKQRWVDRWRQHSQAPSTISTRHDEKPLTFNRPIQYR